MATVYFTNTSDDGAGSLRQALKDANEGDTVTYDPNATWPTSDGPITITLLSPLPSRSEVLDGGERRIVLDGQGSVQLINESSDVSETIRNIDFKDGYKSDSAPIYVSRLASASTLTFENCRFYGGRGYYSGAVQLATSNTAGNVVFNNCVAFDNRGSRSGTPAFLYVANAATPTVLIDGSTIESNRADSKPALGGTGGTITTSYSLIDGEDSVEFSTAGFVDYANYDYRLTATSSYLTGGATSGVDFLGHARSGAIGAFDGSWLVFPAAGSSTISSDTAIDYLEVGDGATVSFMGSDRILAATKGATIGAATFAAASESNGYLAAPAGTSTASAVLTGVKVAAYGAGVTGFSTSVSGSTVSFSIVKTNAVPVLLEKQSAGSWSTVSTDADASTTDSISAPTVYRTFDGATFKTATASVQVAKPFWRITPWAIDGGSFGGDALYKTTSWAIDPETYDD